VAEAATRKGVSMPEKVDTGNLLQEAMQCITSAGEKLNKYKEDGQARDIEGARNQMIMAFSMIGLVLRKAKNEEE
jgi:hypothetical protein